MAKTQLTKNTTTGNWELTETNQPQQYTNTLLTAGLPVEGDIKIDITAKSGSASVDNSTITPTFSRSGNVITVTGSTTTTGTVGTAGWISSITSGTSSIASTGNTYTIPSASSFSLAITDKSSTNLTVGTLSSDYYPFTTSLTGTLTASTGGYFTSGSATDSSVIVGRLPASTPSASVVVSVTPEVDVEGTATGFTPSSTTTSYYVTVSGYIPDGGHGRVKAKYTNSTAGYAPQNTSGTESSETPLDPTIVGDGTKIYIPAGSATTPTNTTALSSTSTSLSGTTLTVQANVTPTVVEGYTTTGTAGTVKISGTVPTESKTVTPNDATQTITPSSGKLLSEVIVNAIPKKRYNISSAMTGTSYYYKIIGEAVIYIYKGTSYNSITVKDTIIRLRSIGNSTSSLTLNYSIIDITGTSSVIGWSSQSLTVSSSETDYGCFILTEGEISFSLGSPTSRVLTSSTTLPSPYALNTAYRTASAIRLYTSATWNGSTTTTYKWINAVYFKITSITKSSSSSGYSTSATINASYSDDGVNWTNITCSASKGGSSSSSISSGVQISFNDLVDDILLEPDSYE